MKRLFSLLLALMILYMALPTAAYAIDAITRQAAERILQRRYEGYIGTVSVVKTGYMNAYVSNDKKSGIIFRVHRGERYLCKEETDDGWYGILFLDGNIGYILQEGTALEHGVTDEQTFSTLAGDCVFSIKTTKKATVYSQPRTRAQSQRESGGNTNTFYFSFGTQLNAFGKTVREGKEWYVVYISGQGNNKTPEIIWLLASDCEVLEGNPDANIVPDWWYDF